MFKTLRHKLLFWFLAFISSNLIVIFVSITYFRQREEIADVFRVIENTHNLLLEDYKIQMNFFTQETRRKFFFEFGVSPFLDRHKLLVDSINYNLSEVREIERIKDFGLQSRIDEMQSYMQNYDATFYAIVDKIQERGFKDHNLIGDIRTAAHKLEALEGVDLVKLLTLRRNEKDYLLRSENIYLRKLNATAKEIQQDVLSNRRLNTDRKEEIISVLNDYLRLMKKLVDLDREIGLVNYGGLKEKLDEEGSVLALMFDAFLEEANVKKEEMYVQLKIKFGVLGVILLSLSIVISLLIAKKITKPLTELTFYITKFVDSNFTFQGDAHVTRTADEIGKLTKNFDVMKDKIIEQLRFFKQKVEERTQELAQANEMLTQVNHANARFVPNEFLDFLNCKSIVDVKLGDNVQKHMTVMFSDIRSFTKHSERMTPQENFDFINTYLDTIAPLIRDHKGFIDKYIGDAVMALFPEKADDAVEAAVFSQHAIAQYNDEHKKKGFEPIIVGTGIHCGNLILGTIGTESRMDTTVISDAVNTAARMEGLTVIYGGNIIVTGSLVEQLQDKSAFHYRYLDTVKVKGKDQSTVIYEILDGLDNAAIDAKLSSLIFYKEAIAHYKQAELSTALDGFRKVLDINPADIASQLYVERCEHYLKVGIPDKWDGSQQMTTKKG